MDFLVPSIKFLVAPPSFWLLPSTVLSSVYLITMRSAVVVNWEEPPNISLSVAKNAFAS